MDAGRYDAGILDIPGDITGDVERVLVAVRGAVQRTLSMDLLTSRPLGLDRQGDARGTETLDS